VDVFSRRTRTNVPSAERPSLRMTIIEPSIGEADATEVRRSGKQVCWECTLCPHHCLLSEGETGRCRARRATGTGIEPLNYGKICAQAVDQIEKKPIYHYRPGSKLLSIGTFGCNLDCDCCQNASLAMSDADDVRCSVTSPGDLVEMALQRQVQGIAFTFNEPIIWYEYILDVAKLARSSGLFTLMNSNGHIEMEPLKRLASVVDAFKIDVKGFDEGFYERHCGGQLGPVLRTCEYLAAKGVHLEVAYLMIPGLNDSEVKMNEFFHWVRSSLGPQVPVHLYKFMPAHRLPHLPPTDEDAMKAAKRAGMAVGLDFIYLSGMVGGDEHNTVCPICRTVVVDRTAESISEKVVCDKGRLSKFCPSYSSIKDVTISGKCPKCGKNILRSG